MSLLKVLAASKRHMGTYTKRDLFWLERSILQKKVLCTLIDHMRADNHGGNSKYKLSYSIHVIHYYKMPLNTIEKIFFPVKIYRNMDKILNNVKFLDF